MISTARLRSDGIELRSTLLAVGNSNRQLRSAVGQGLVMPVGRKLLVTSRCNPQILRAVRAGARLGCLSAALERGLWVLDDERLHIVAGNGHAVEDGGDPPFRVHWIDGPERDSTPGIESIPNMLVHLAHCRPIDEAVAVLDSSIKQEMISLNELSGLAAHLGGHFAKVARLVTGRADSGLESLCRVRLLLAGIITSEQAVVDGHPVDLLVDKVVIQLDGKQHLDDHAQHSRDRKQDRRLQRMGYTVLRFGYREVVLDWPTVLAEIQAHLAYRAYPINAGH